MYVRPKPEETDEDLLQMQEEFKKNLEANKIKLAANVVKSDQSNSVPRNDNPSNTDIEEDIQEQISNTFESIPPHSNLGSVTEKKSFDSQRSSLQFNNERGFPQAKRRKIKVNSGKGSIFSQQFKRLKKEQPQPMEIDVERPGPSHSAIENRKPKDNVQLDEQSYILTGQDKEGIHEENINKIKHMTESEILEEKETLLQTMDPALIAFLKSRRKENQIKENRSKNLTIKEQKEAGDVKVEEIDTTAEILQNPQADKWLNFNTLEKEKLAWMKNLEIPKITKEKSYEARFDFEGWLLPYATEEVSEKNRILFHHGEDPHRPGYTLQELFQLSRSTVIQQKIISLNTLANILALYSTGVYQDIIELPIEQIFFVLRFCLDDNTPSVLSASVRAIRNLICNQMDEVCLDSLLCFGLGIIQPTLAVDDDDGEDDTTVNDQQLAEKNIVKCLVRTEILTRIRYIINAVKPPLETIVCCLDILTRLARDSQFIMTKVYKSDNLIQSIVDNFVPKELKTGSQSTAYGSPIPQSIKFLRIISYRSKLIASQLVNTYNIMDSITKYIFEDTFSSNANGLKLQIECYHFLFILDYYKLINKQQILPICLRTLDYHLKNTNLDMQTTFVRQSHVGAVLNLLSTILDKSDFPEESNVKNLLVSCLHKWGSQLESLSTFVCGKLQIICSLVQCISTLFEKTILDGIRNIADEAILKLINSKGFLMISNSIQSGSMVLNNYETLPFSPNLKTLQSAAWYTFDHVIPLLQSNSCIPLLKVLANYVDCSHNKELKVHFLKHPNIQKYIDALVNGKHYYLTSNWFSRIESHLVMSLLKISISVQNNVDTSIFYQLAVKTLSLYFADQKSNIEYVLRKIVFCPEFYPPETRLQHLNLNQRSENLVVSLNNLEEIAEVYTQVLGLKLNLPSFSTSLCLDINLGNVIPIDWIYTPIIVLYTNQQENKSNRNELQETHIIKNCLRWILIYETYFPVLVSQINPTDRFCRIACVFLGSDNLFLNDEIHGLLEICLKNIITNHENDLDFEKSIEGLSNFQDFFTQLLEQYQGVSYGDILFGNVILIPLAQKHNVQYRKTLWSEYIGVVQTFNVSKENCLCDLNSFLTPSEEEITLLKCYRRSLVNNLIRKHSVLFTIANNHVEEFIRRKQNK